MVRLWLKSLLGLVLLLVLVGGITRITGSGLSITEWRPITGAIPPLNEAQWLVEFEKYKTIPQFQMFNSGMDIEGFKKIFFWEWLHRLLGRIIGLVSIVPWVIFVVRKKITGAAIGQTALIWITGGLQAFVGWFMVMSGLTERPYVSELRLAIHFFMAMLIVGMIQTQILKNSIVVAEKIKARRWIVLTFVVFLLQVFYGALTAGLKAGYSFNTFPTMNGAWVPDGMEFHNSTFVQWVHRWLAVAVLGMVFWMGKLLLNSVYRKMALLAMGLVGLQFLLGVFTLLFQVPVVLGSLHQINAFLLFMALWNLVWRSRIA